MVRSITFTHTRRCLFLGLWVAGAVERQMRIPKANDSSHTRRSPNSRAGADVSNPTIGKPSRRLTSEEGRVRPDTSQWRDSSRYSIFDTLSVEDIAWECLRRSEPYQEHFGELVAINAEGQPFSTEVQHRWGLRFPGTSEPVGARSGRHLVAARQPSRVVCRPRARLSLHLA